MYITVIFGRQCESGLVSQNRRKVSLHSAAQTLLGTEAAAKVTAWNLRILHDGEPVTLTDIAPGLSISLLTDHLVDVTEVILTPFRVKELVATHTEQATNPPDNLAQPNEQSRSQTTQKVTAMSQVNASIPVQTLTFVFGQRIDTMGKTELFTCAQAVASQIEGLEKSNNAVGSVAIEQEIAGLKKDLASIRKLLDDQFATVATPTAAE